MESTMSLQLSLTFEKIYPILTPDDIYSSISPELIERLNEDRRIERKSAATHARELGTYFSMWANTPPEGGLLLLGVEDNGKISGCNHLSDMELNEREKAAWTYCPDSRSESKRIQTINMNGEQDFIVAVRIFYREDKVVTDVSGNVYIRDGDSRRRLSAEEIRELQNDKGQVDLEREPVPLRYPQDFNFELIQEFSEGVRKLRQLSADHTSEEI